MRSFACSNVACLTGTHPQSPSSSALSRGSMPRLLAGAVWMLGSGPSMTEDQVGKQPDSADTRVGNVVLTRQIITCDPSSTTRFAGRRK
ncbi:hypothetical protein AMC82_CH00889 [Rhizobium phaseoli]|nr:hypothetical protein AMC82_CH00889 [Rhizobium phaseoli]